MPAPLIGPGSILELPTPSQWDGSMQMGGVVGSVSFSHISAALSQSNLRQAPGLGVLLEVGVSCMGLGAK